MTSSNSSRLCKITTQYIEEIFHTTFLNKYPHTKENISGFLAINSMILNWDLTRITVQKTV